MKRIKIELEINDKLYDFIKKLATFRDTSPEEIIKDRARTHIESLPEDLEPYFDPYK